MLVAGRIVLVLASAGPLTPLPAIAHPASAIASAVVIVVRAMKCVSPFRLPSTPPAQGGARWRERNLQDRVPVRARSCSIEKPCVPEEQKAAHSAKPGPDRRSVL